MIGLVGSKGSGKTVLMTVLVRYLREVIGRRFGADIRIATDNPDGYRGIRDYQTSREVPLYGQRTLPASTAQLGSSPARQRATPIVLRWRQEAVRLIGGRALRSTILSLIDTAGEDLNDMATAFTLEYISVCDALIVTMDLFALPGARAGLNLPTAAIQVDDDVPLDVLSRITELLRTEHNVRRGKKISIPVAIAFTKVDALYPALDPAGRIMGTASAIPAYDDADGLAIHEHVLALMHEWNASDIDAHLRLNYADYRYFALSALGDAPDYGGMRVAPGGVHPHRVEDPVLWLLSKTGAVAVV
jgi:GTPase SAR1 family protein